MHRHPDYTRHRLQQLKTLLASRIYADRRPLQELLVSERTGRISHTKAQTLEKWAPASMGQRFGPLFATYWFKAKAQIPEAWHDRRVDLIWASQSEATLWIDGESRQGLNCGNFAFGNGDAVREDAVLLRRATGGQLFRFQIEMACNRLGGYGSEIEMPSLLKVHSPYMLERAEIALFDPEAWDLFHDYRVLQELEAEQGHALDKTWGGLLLAELNRFANLYEADDRKTWAPAREILRALYRNRNGGTVHELSAIGHAHIDTAWLWPLAETARKCERSFSTAVGYMDEYPEYKFACSQGYQYDVIRRRNPELYRRIREKISSGQWIPVGGSWIEPDCNLPSGESLCRQFIYGQRFFRREFGLTCREFWNPDVFGYNGQLPQIMRLAGITRFLTQKLSWNQFTKPLHHTFIWEGIDGSEVFTHFPPLDTYNAEARVRDLRRSADNYKDHDRSRRSIMLYGYGDGGGGPTREMLETIRRAADLQGVPRTRQQSSADFFQALEEDNTDRARQVGELYLEYHRGTYTTQAAAKKGNRRGEILLHEAEFLCTAASLTLKCGYPASTLDRLWKILLLHQFHDILPGSSIREVYEDTARAHSLISRKAERLIDRAGAILAGEGNDVTVINTTGFERSEVVTLENGSLAFATSPSYGVGRLAPAEDRVVASDSAEGITLENQYLRAILARDGSLTSLIYKPTNREALAAPANVFELYPDNPTNYDAWDIDPFHLEKMNPCPPADSCALAGRHELRAEVSFARRIGTHSTLRQTVRLSAHSQTLEFHTEVDWKETHQLLKVAFPVSVRAMNATYEMQFGVVERPTHFNTLRDLAQYEVPAHRWSDLSEPGFGVALLSNSKYGFSTFENTLRLSLLRAPTYPDPEADRGIHRFAYALMPHPGDWRTASVVTEGIRFNVPLRLVPKSQPPVSRSFFSVDQPNLILDTVKGSDSEPGAVVLRLYESAGARGMARVTVPTNFRSARLVDLLEENGTETKLLDGVLVLPFRPFQILTIQLR